MSHLWLRHEYKSNERRAPITPGQVGQLIERGHRVTVESSPRRVFHDAEYTAQGAELARAGHWHHAPSDAFVLGIKEVLQEELHAENTALRHRHIYFAHIFKGQRWTPETMRRFTLGRGTLLDLEYLVDETGKRVAAFSYSAGYAGAVAAVQIWLDKAAGKRPPFGLPCDYLSRRQFVEELGAKLKAWGTAPRTLIIGANGRSGKGAADFFAALGLTPVKWGRAETAKGGPFAELLDYDIVCNCVYLSQAVPPFLTAGFIADHPETKLSVVADISNDLSYNPIFGISTSTTFANATVQVAGVDVIEIENLPVLTPLDSSVEYAEQFFPHLVALLETSAQTNPVWERAALKYFEHHDIPQIAMESGHELAELYADAVPQVFAEEARDHLRDLLAKNPFSPTERLFFADYLIAGAAEVLGETELEAFKDQLAKINLDEIYDSSEMHRHHRLLRAINQFTRSTDFQCFKPDEAREAFFEMCDGLAGLINQKPGAEEKYLDLKQSLLKQVGEECSRPVVNAHLLEIERAATERA